MSSSLFRKEALEHRKDKLYGDVILLQPLSLTVLVGVVVVISAMVLGILFWGTYARKEMVRGYLVPDKGIVKISAPQPGTIENVHIREGDVVTEGQSLLTIKSERSIQGGNDIDALKLNEIETTQKQLQERIQGEKNLFKSNKSQLESQIISLKQELGQIGQTLKNQENRLQMVESRVAGGKKLLESKHLSEVDYQKLYDELLGQKQQYQEMLRTKGGKENALKQTQSELEQLPIRTHAQINDLENKISELKQRHADVQEHRLLEIRSPVAGVVTSLQARTGHWLTTNVTLTMPLLAILPKDAVMQAELYVPSKAIGFITPGQVVRMRFDAFPYRRFGIYEGTVDVISKHVLLPSELSVPMDLKEPVYRVTVNLQQQDVTAYGKSFPLQAGMSLEADIILDRQTLFEKILDPLFSLKGRF